MIALLATLLAATAPQDKPSTAADAAAKFSLDLPTSDAPAEPAVTPPVLPPDAAVTAPPEPASAAASFSLDTPIATLLTDYRAKAVLDRNLPGLSTDENLAKFQRLSLRQFAPLTGGQLTADLMTKTAYDLAAIGAGTAMPPTTKRRSIGR